MTKRPAWTDRKAWTPGRIVARVTHGSKERVRHVQARLSSLVVRPPPLGLVLLIAPALIVAETLVLYPVERVAPATGEAAVYLLGVVVVALAWGFWPAAATSVVSTLTFDYFYVPPPLDFIPTRAADTVGLGIFLVVALLISAVADLARSRAIEVSQRRREVSMLADQQAALRRVATLVARGVAPSDVFAAVAREMTRCLGVAEAQVSRYDGKGGADVLAAHHNHGSQMLLDGEHVTLEGDNVASIVLRTARPARMNTYEDATGSLAARVRELGIRSVAAAPIMVGGRVWGAALVGSRRLEPLPANIEDRIADFADLVATAIANAATRAELQVSRDSLGVLADQQAALRRVATLVARGARPSEVYSAVAEEIIRCLDVDTSGVWRYESDQAITLLAGHSRVGWQYLPVGERLTLEGDNLGAMVLRSGCAVRHNLAGYAAGSAAARIRELRIGEGVGAPIVVNGNIWGLAIAATTRSDPMPPDSEERIGDFADLVAIAIANAAKHARASEVCLRAESDGANLCLLIRDNGTGGADPGKGSGLIGLIGRVEALGGDMKIESPPGIGTTLYITIPLGQGDS